MSPLRALHILHSALFTPSLPLRTRLLLFLLQPISILTYTIEWARARRFPHSFDIQIPVRRRPGGTLRALVYIPTSMSTPLSTSKDKNKDKSKPTLAESSNTGPGLENAKEKKRPIHLNIHGGAFLGGLPEGNAWFCYELAQRSGAVVVSTTYRYAPAAVFPDAHEDVQDVASWVVENAELWDADGGCFTVSGFSVGGNLALGVAQAQAQAHVQSQSQSQSGGVKGLVTFYGVVDFRIPPWKKPVPSGFPEKDPLSFLQPLFDIYAGANRARDLQNPLLHPTLADIKTLPQNMLFVVGDKDILHDETIEFTERLAREASVLNKRNGVEESNSNYEVEGECMTMKPDGKAVVVRREVFEGQIHGWLEMPSAAIDVKTRTKAFGDAIEFLRDVHRAYGYNMKVEA
ncbi:Alpha/Beta hydrolase protein [Aspergillus karnatakaensis]|uniref:putative lipase/esterase family protein n=1 Tax=Aspergillus karnatakaensis TaxID=1810916 RepID=UPI003CCCFB11